MLRRLTLLALLASQPLAAGCAPGNPGLVVLGHTSPDSMCLVSSTATEFLTNGVLDTSGLLGPVSYTANFTFQNQLIDLGSTGTNGPPRANPNHIQVELAEVQINDAAGTPINLGGLPNPFTVPATGYVASGATGVGSVQIIPPIYGAALSGMDGVGIVVSVKAIGYTQAGAEIVSDPYLWPITLCSGCLFQCVLDDMCQPVTTTSCTPGQDELVSTPLACPSPLPPCS